MFAANRCEYTLHKVQQIKYGRIIMTFPRVNILWNEKKKILKNMSEERVNKTNFTYENKIIYLHWLTFIHSIDHNENQKN